MRPLLQYLLFSFLFLILVNAAPLLQRDVTASQLSQFNIFAQYAGAAYCYGNVHGTGKKLSCSGENGSCPLVESAQASVLQSFALGATETTGYVAVDDTRDLIIISIQGTSVWSNAEDIITDIDVNRVKTNLCGLANTKDGCEIHQGFWNASNDVLDTVKTSVASALQSHPGYRVISAGHSLGGAVAALLGAQLRNSGTNVDIYTYGQPKLGSADISLYIQNQAPSKGVNNRITHYNDVVPQLPEHVDILGEWDHFYPEFWISLDDGTPKTTDIQVVNGSLYETAGNEGEKTGLGVLVDIAVGVRAHFDYFGKISSCDSRGP